MRSFLGIGVALAIGVVGVVEVTGAQQELTKQDRQGPVTVAVTLMEPPVVGAPLKAKVVLDTHSVGLDSIAFEKAVVLRTSDGTDVAPSAVEASGSGHHREAVLIFPTLTQAGTVRIVVKDVGGVPERSFLWEVASAR